MLIYYSNDKKMANDHGVDVSNEEGGDFLEKSVTKVYGSMILALQGCGCQFFRKKALYSN